jgi:hypothetical protein
MFQRSHLRRFLTVKGLWLLGGALALTLTQQAVAAPAENIAMKPAPRSLLTGVKLQGASRVLDANLRSQFSGQMQILLKEVNKKLPWRAQIIQPEVLAWQPPYYSREGADQLTADVASELLSIGYETNFTDLGKSDGTDLRLMLGMMPGRALVGIWALDKDGAALGWAFLAPDVRAGGKVLRPGQPALTEGLVSRWAQMTAWMFGKPLSSTQNARLQNHSRDYLLEVWRRADAKRIAGTMSALYAFGQRQPGPSADAMRLWLLGEWQKTARRTSAEPSLRAIVKIYDELNPPRAAAKPGVAPLSDLVRDAWVEMQAFSMRQIPGGVTLTAAEKSSLRQWVTEKYPTWNAATQARMHESPLAWASLRLGWNGFSAGQKQGLKTIWTKTVSGLAASVRNNRAQTQKLLVAQRQEAQAAQASVAQAPTAPTRIASTQRSGSGHSTVRRTSTRGSAATYASLSRKLAMRQQMNQWSQKMMWESHYKKMNAMYEWGGSSQRYVNAYGNPY